MASAIWPGNGSIELVEGQDRCGAGLGRFWHEEKARDGELWPARRAAAHCTGSAQSELDQEEEGEGGNEVECREWISTSPRRVRGAIADAWRNSPAATVAGMGVGDTVEAHRKHSELVLPILTRF